MVEKFYRNTKTEISDIENNVFLKEKEQEKNEEEHRVEVKVYLQKVRHLEYE